MPARGNRWRERKEGKTGEGNSTTVTVLGETRMYQGSMTKDVQYTTM